MAGRTMKTCSRCTRRRRLASFNRASGSSDGHRSECRDCQRAADATYIAQPEIREWRRETAELWWAKHARERNERRRREYAARSAG